MDFEVVDRPAPEPRRKKPSRERQFTCANCGASFVKVTNSDPVYCSPKCDSTASAVRYGRAKLDEFGDLRDLPDDIALGLKYKVAHALGSGYDRNARTIPPTTRRQVMERDQRKCVQCGGAGEEIDHIDGDSNDLANLRLLCKDCHNTITDDRLVPIVDDATRDYRDQIMLRIHASEPLRECDSKKWRANWRAWVRAHEVAPQ